MAIRGGALAIVLVSGGCALDHEREGVPVPFDAGEIGRDTPVVITEVGTMPRDVGLVTSCSDFWTSLPACPASPALAIGQGCSVEGATCGVNCCEPGPPIGCEGGQWHPLDHMADCSGVRCAPALSCGAGSCAANRVCLIPSGPLGSPGPEICALPPSPIDSCADAPPGSIGSDAMMCIACECQMSPAGQPIVAIDCRCC